VLVTGSTDDVAAISASMLAWVISTPFGGPVVPDV
jgi:hypothetical protein